MINILHFFPSSSYGGAEEHTRIILQYLNKKNFIQYIACPQDKNFWKYLPAPINKINFKYENKFNFLQIKKLAEIIKKLNINILHSHNRRTDYAVFLAKQISGGGNLKLITTVHDRPDVKEDGTKEKLISTSLHKIILKKFNLIITVSQQTKKEIKKFANLPENKVIAITNGIEFFKLKDYLQKDAKEKLNLPQNKIIIGLMGKATGNYLQKKGIPTFLKTANYLKKNNQIYFLIVGVNNQAQQIIYKYLKKKNLQNILVLNFVKDKNLFYSAIDILCIPSLYEGLPRVLLEGMYLKKPVIASNIDGIKEVVRDNYNGLFVETKNAELLAEKILLLASDKNLQKTLAENAYHTICQKYSYVNMVSQMEEIYKMV